MRLGTGGRMEEKLLDWDKAFKLWTESNLLVLKIREVFSNNGLTLKPRVSGRSNFDDTFIFSEVLVYVAIAMYPNFEQKVQIAMLPIDSSDSYRFHLSYNVLRREWLLEITRCDATRITSKDYIGKLLKELMLHRCKPVSDAYHNSDSGTMEVNLPNFSEDYALAVIDDLIKFAERNSFTKD